MPRSTGSLDRFIGAALDRRHLSIRAFASKVGVTHVFVIRVRQGKAHFPPEHFECWCNALSLTLAQRDVFLRLSLLARCPPEIRMLVASLERRLMAYESVQHAHRQLRPRPTTRRRHPQG